METVTEAVLEVVKEAAMETVTGATLEVLTEAVLVQAMPEEAVLEGLMEAVSVRLAKPMKEREEPRTREMKRSVEIAFFSKFFFLPSCYLRACPSSCMHGRCIGICIHIYNAWLARESYE